MEERANWTEVSPAEAYFQAALQLAQYRLIQQEIPSQDECEEDDELDQRILHMIDDQLRKRHRQTAVKTSVMNVIRTIVIVLLIGNLFVTTAFALSEGFRERVIQLFVTTYETHSSIELKTDDSAVEHREAYATVPEYRLSWLPNKEMFIAEQTYSPLACSVTYLSDDGSYITLDVHNGDMLYDADTEGMACSEVSIGNKKLQLFHDSNEYVLIWREDRLYFVLDAEGLTESEVTLAAMSACPITSTNQQE